MDTSAVRNTLTDGLEVNEITINDSDLNRTTNLDNTGVNHDNEDQNKNSGSSIAPKKRILQKARFMLCCLHPHVQHDSSEERGYHHHHHQQTGTTHGSNSQKPVSRVYPSPDSCDYIIGQKTREDYGKKTLVLDLDETLVHSSFDPVVNHDFIIPVDIDGQLKDVYVQKRPWLDHFLKIVCQKFEVVIFTASLSKYADPLLDSIDSAGEVRWRLFRDACRPHRGNYVKDLNRLGRELSQTIIIDNSPLSYVFQPGNAVPIPGFVGDQNDRCLLDILPILQDLADTADVRDCIKRRIGESTAIMAADQNHATQSDLQHDNVS